MSDFSLRLSDDQITVRDWVHGFALNVMRPAAHEWDEREETPWPVIQEAAAVGIYSLDFFSSALADPTGLTMVMALEELAWGDAGLCMAIMGSTLAMAAIMGNGTAEQVGEWIPACFGTPSDVAIAAHNATTIRPAAAKISNPVRLTVLGRMRRLPPSAGVAAALVMNELLPYQSPAF